MKGVAVKLTKIFINIGARGAGEVNTYKFSAFCLQLVNDSLIFMQN